MCIVSCGVLRGKHLFSPLKPEEGITAEAFRLLYPQVISDIKVRAVVTNHHIFVCVHMYVLAIHVHLHAGLFVRIQCMYAYIYPYILYVDSIHISYTV